jgi:hypothetical protein
MSTDLRISDVHFAAACLEQRSKGMLGWIRCSIGGNLQLDGLALRRTTGGKYRLSFPHRVDANGVTHDLIKPLSNGVRDAIEGQVIGELRRRGYVT